MYPPSMTMALASSSTKAAAEAARSSRGISVVLILQGSKPNWAGSELKSPKVAGTLRSRMPPPPGHRFLFYISSNQLQKYTILSFRWPGTNWIDLAKIIWCHLSNKSVRTRTIYAKRMRDRNIFMNLLLKWCKIIHIMKISQFSIGFMSLSSNVLSNDNTGVVKDLTKRFPQWGSIWV